jgi:hypothetical protein
MNGISVQVLKFVREKENIFDSQAESWAWGSSIMTSYYLTRAMANTIRTISLVPCAFIGKLDSIGDRQLFTPG